MQQCCARLQQNPHLDHSIALTPVPSMYFFVCLPTCPSTTIYLVFYENEFLKNRTYIFLEYTGIALKVFYITKEASANFKKLVTFITAIKLMQLNNNTTNAKEQYEEIEETLERKRREVSSRELAIPREYFMQRWAQQRTETVWA